MHVPVSGSAPLSVVFVLSLGAFSGGVVKGITGFGNAIINLLVWVAFTAAGVNAGPLQMAVLADSLACVLCSIPLLVMTSAHKTADWRLVFTVLIFGSAGTPLGAALLKFLPVRWIELGMACVLLLVICVHVRLHDKLRKLMNKSRSVQAGASDESVGPPEGSLTAADAPPAGSLPVKAADGLPCAAAPPACVNDAASPGRSNQLGGGAAAGIFTDTDSPVAATKDDANYANTSPASATIIHISCCGLPSGDTHSPPSCGLEATSGAAGQQQQQPDATQMAEGQPDAETGASRVYRTAAHATVAEDAQPLLGPGVLASDAVGPASVPGRRCSNSGAGARASSSAGCAPAKGSLGSGLRRWLERQNWAETRRIAMFGSVAGFASGVMGGMTGIGGPPLMYLYEKLQVAKEVVRGTNAVNNVLQVRLISYIVMGVFKREDMLLYAITSVVGLGGVVVGNSLVGRLDQRAFSRVLVALMVICCLLLFASAAGLKNRGA